MFHRIAYSNSIIDSFDTCLADCLEAVKRLSEQNTLLGVVFFIDARTPDSFKKANQAISTALSENEMLFPYNVLAQAGCCPVSIEIWIDPFSIKTEYLTYKGMRYSRFNDESGVSICGMGLCHSNMLVGIHEQTDETFNILVEILQKEGLSLSDIVRQWNYVPGILTMENKQGKYIQHYQTFNEVRKRWYGKETFPDDYPAATGIGVETGPFSIDFIAMKSSPTYPKKNGFIQSKASKCLSIYSRTPYRRSPAGQAQESSPV